MTKQTSALVAAKDGGEAQSRRLLVTCFFALFALLLILPTFGRAQTYNFGSVRIEGNQRIESAAIANYAAIPRGKPVTAGQVNAAYQRVLESGLFETVEMVPSGNTLVIKVAEYPTINRINFEGNKRLKDDALRAIVESEERRVLNPTVAERDAARITQAYSEQGRLAARVNTRVIRRGENRADLIFEVFEGGVVEIERLGIVGNRNYSDHRLRRVLNTKQAGLLRAFFKQDTFVNDRIEFDKQVLQDFYQSRGYVDFRVLSVNAELSRERDGYFLTFNIEEGQQFKFGEITASSEIDGVDAQQYLETLKLRPGVIYSPTLVENSIARMERFALKQGQDFLRIDPRISRNDRDLTLDVEFVLTNGPKIFVERIDIEGNTTTLDKVIRNQFRIAEGDPFNPREIRESAERIRALGFFGVADVNAREGSSPEQVIVDVDVEEQPTGSLSLGGSFSTNDGLGLVVRFNETNFLGRGQSLGLSFSTSSDVKDYSFSFAEPAFLGRNLTAGFGFTFQEFEPSQARFVNTVGDFTPYLGFQLGDYSRMRLRYSLVNSELKVADANRIPGGSIIDSEADRGDIWKSSVGYTYRYDTRRGGLDPTRGYLFEFSQDFGGLGGDYNFVKSTARAVAEARVLHEEVTLRATLQGGALYSPNGDSRIDDRYIVTNRNIRGFKPYGVGPREYQAGVQDDAIGGTYYASMSLEAEFPLGLPEELGISGGVFYDVGSLWGLDQTSPNVLYEDFSLRHVIGASIFWTTPIGPLRFNFTKALKKEQFDKEQNFDFTISAQF